MATATQSVFAGSRKPAAGNRFPGFSYEVQGVYPVAEDGRTRFYTYVVKE